MGYIYTDEDKRLIKKWKHVIPKGINKSKKSNLVFILENQSIEFKKFEGKTDEEIIKEINPDNLSFLEFGAKICKKL